MDLLTNDDLIAILQDAIRRHGGAARYAKRLGVSCAFVSRMVHGRKYISGKILEDLGYERVVRFQKVIDAADAHLAPAPAQPAPGGNTRLASARE